MCFSLLNEIDAYSWDKDEQTEVMDRSSLTPKLGGAYDRQKPTILQSMLLAWEMGISLLIILTLELIVALMGPSLADRGEELIDTKIGGWHSTDKTPTSFPSKLLK